MEPLLKVDNLSTHYFTRAGVVKAVDKISFEVAEGETVGIVGESGCGKSATALSIMRLIPTPPGRVVDGRIMFSPGEGKAPVDLLTVPETEMQALRGNMVAMVFQDPMTSLNPVLTIGWQLREPLQLHLGMNKREARDRSIELLKLVNIPSPEQRLDDYPHQFSGGMRQRVMIAMAMACNPKLLLADEPTTALDVTIQAQILELMKKLQDKLKMSVVLITHDLGVVGEVCDRVLVMYAGEIIESASVDDLFDNPKHPYTRGLLQSVPKLGPTVKDRMKPIDGAPPDLIAMPPGCRFAPRCPKTFDLCKDEPTLKEVGPNHKCACWLY
ncbi:MAG TPA: ABC transporter ATP-binding protein [candidate division Zixibacteria bacterium]|jgi:oligopeptide transport system ATP-binding protein|nr:ABC transporter ATP-binding protein [candidate division Zixibacteria bacterium]